MLIIFLPLWRIKMVRVVAEKFAKAIEVEEMLIVVQELIDETR